jgi:hypothetical protein
MQFVGIPSETLYWILLTVWPISGLVVFYPRTEELLARWFHRFRPPSALEMQRIGPAWWRSSATARHFSWSRLVEANDTMSSTPSCARTSCPTTTSSRIAMRSSLPETGQMGI